MVSLNLFQRGFVSSRVSVWHLLAFASLALLLRLDARAAEIYANEPSPYNAAKGAAFGYPDAVQFLVPGWAPASSWRWTGTLPPGLSLGGRTTAGDFNTTNWPEIVGTPTTPGTYNITIRASQGLDQAGPFTPVINYQIYVSPDYYPPLFKNMPASQTTTAGTSVTLSAPAYFGKTYQWKFNGVDISGATGDSYTFTASAASAGFYSTMSWGDGGSALSSEATVTVITAPPASAALATGAQLTLTVGVANAGGSTYQWNRNGTAIAGATSSTYVVPAVTVATAGSYTVSVANYGQVATSAAALVTVDGTGPVRATSRLGCPALQHVRPDQPGRRPDHDRGIRHRWREEHRGPRRGTWAGHLVSKLIHDRAQVLPDPRLRVFSGSAVMATNEDWDASLAAGFTRLGAFPLTSGSRDSALLQSIDGAQTLHVTGTGSGIVLFEGYDADTTASSRLKNLAARNRVGTGGDILIAGFVVAGTGNETLLIRGVGPTLFDSFGIADRLLDPKLEIYDSTGTKVAENDNWSASLASVFTQVGAVALTAGSKDAALQVTSAPGRLHGAGLGHQWQ
jgi:hypothetical protein